MAKYTLDNDFDFDFDLIGISCREKSHKMAWLINKNLKLKLKRVENHSIVNKKNTQEHSIFEYIDKKREESYFLIKNKSENGFIAIEQKAIDYFVLVDRTIINKTDKIIKEIRNIDSVLLAIELNILELKSKENFIL